MFIEAATALLLVFRRPEDIPLAALVGLALVGVVWLSTALLQVPRHSTLGSGFDHAAWSGLVLTPTGYAPSPGARAACSFCE